MMDLIKFRLYDSEAAGQQQLTAKIPALAALVKLFDTPEAESVS